MDVFAVLGDFLQWVGSLLPRWKLICTTEGAVVFRRRGEKIVRGPKIVWWIPCVSDLEVIPIVRQVIDLHPQTLTTKDSHPVIAGAVVVYDVQDVRKFLVENFDAEQSIAEVAGAALRETIVDKTFDEIQDNPRKTTDNALSRAASDHLSEYGVRVERMRLTDFAKARIINFVGLAPSFSSTHQEASE